MLRHRLLVQSLDALDFALLAILRPRQLCILILVSTEAWAEAFVTSPVHTRG